MYNLPNVARNGDMVLGKLNRKAKMVVREIIRNQAPKLFSMGKAQRLDGGGRKLKVKSRPSGDTD